MSATPSARRLLVAALVSAFAAAPAWAQDAVPARLMASAATEATRWPGAAADAAQNPVTLRLEAGTTVDVLTAEGDQLRVRQGLTFGWVARTAMTAPTEAGATIQLGAPPPSLR